MFTELKPKQYKIERCSDLSATVIWLDKENVRNHVSISIPNQINIIICLLKEAGYKEQKKCLKQE